MSGETEEQVSGWTVDTLRQHVQDMMREADRRYEQRFEAQEKAVEAALANAKEANGKSERSDEKRFEAVNEFRDQQRDLIGTFMPRSEAEQIFQQLREAQSDIKTRQDTSEGRGVGLNAGWIYLLGAATFVAALVAIAVALTR